MENFSIPAADTPWLDEQSGLVSEAWYIYLANLFGAIAQGFIGTPNQVLHGGGAGYAPVSLTADITGRLLLANFVRAAAGNILIAQGVGVDDIYAALSGDGTLSAAGALAVTRINGAALGTTTPTSANLLIGDGTQWVTRAMSGDATISNAGAVTVGASGTWTPTDASGAALSLSSVSAVYAKIGKLVVATARFTYPVTANGANAKIGGLPFTSANVDGARSGLVSYFNGTISPYIVVDQNATTASIYNGGGTGGGNVVNSTLSTYSLYVELTYQVA